MGGRRAKGALASVCSRVVTAPLLLCQHEGSVRGRPCSKARMTDESGIGIIDRHLRICRMFGDEVTVVGGRWGSPSPCTGWDARAVLEHVIGFHDVVLLSPLGAKPHRPKDDPVVRWTVTVQALDRLFKRRPDLFDGLVDLPAIRNNPATQIDGIRLVSALSLDVLIHTWDLAQAAGHDIVLDPGLCASFLSGLPADTTALSESGMYDEPREVPAGADAQTELLARLGRDPGWCP
jgi:uncharacterized protein (TIGR03086 family)